MKWQLVWWLVLSLVSHNIPCKFPAPAQDVLEDTQHKKCFSDIFESGTNNDFNKAMKKIKQDVEVEVKSPSISKKPLVAGQFKPQNCSTGIEIYANEKQVKSNEAVSDHIVNVHLPRELDIGTNTVVFCMFTWTETNEGPPGPLYENRVIGLSVGDKKVSGLHERANITMNLTTVINETQEPICVFYNFSTQTYSSNGCLTLWKRNQSHITCSCNHFTYFGVLMVTATNLSSEDVVILTYITLIACSLSLFGLVITLLLFITNRKVRTDVSMKVHISLAIALILLNVHFLASQQLAALCSTGSCFYMALALHYSLLATFSWMALEGVHLYILLVRVFNIYIRRYLLRLSVVGWSVPAVIVSLVVIIDRDAYGHAPLNPSNSSDTTVCYITNNTVKIVTTMGVFALVFIFNMIMLVVTIRRVLSCCHDKEFGQSNNDRAKRDILTLLGVSTLLGITWGLVFFTFGSLTTPALYLFCILNSLQGFFIFLWFVMSLRKTGKSATKTSSETRSTS